MPKRKRVRKRNGIRPLTKHERDYLNSVLKLMGEAYQIPLRTELLTSYDPETFLASIAKIQKEVAANPTFGQAEAEAAIAQISAYQKRRFTNIVKSVSIQLGIFGDASDRMVVPVLQESLQNNVGLIKNLANDYGDKAYKDIAAIIEATGFDQAEQRAQIQAYLAKGGKGSEYVRNRAKLITRDQNNKLIGELNKTRHKAVGGTQYFWSTSDDIGVRDGHQMLDNSLQNWAEPPLGGGTSLTEHGHPGHGINCRCVATFVFEL